MKKLLSVLAVILLLAALSVPVCAAEVNTLVYTFEMRGALLAGYWNTYVVTPLSAERKQEIEDAWLAQNGYALNDDLDMVAYGDYGDDNGIFDILYYGNFGGCEVFLEPLAADDATTIEVAGHILKWDTAFNVHVYRDGEFLDLQKAYAENWLNDSDISRISELAACTNHMKYDEYVLDECVDFYGTYDGCYVGFVNLPIFEYPAEKLVVNVGGFDFVYPNSQQLEVYKDGQMMNLEKAYEAGWLTDGAVEILWDSYTNGIYHSPATGDGVWMPVALLVVSGIAMTALICKRKKMRL